MELGVSLLYNVTYIPHIILYREQIDGSQFLWSFPLQVN